MANMTKDLWATDWTIHQDPMGILKGIKDLQFTLARDKSVPNLVVYDIDYTPENPQDDPFVNTKFVQFGDDFPKSPTGKLKPWKVGEEQSYQDLITLTFGSAPSNIARLIGEKVVKNKKEVVTLLLIPDAIDTTSGNPKIGDLMQVVCSTSAKPAPGASFQDGTAHGNPK